MKTSTNLKFQIPELDDQANVTVIASALEALDDACGDALSMNGDASSAQVTFERASSRENITSRDTLGTIAAKLSRWLADIKDAAFSAVANNDSTVNSGYVLDARVGKTHGDEIDKLNTQVGGLYFGTNDAGKWGYKTSANGTVNPFRNPVGTAGTGDVLAGKTFANASSDSLTGTMPNQGAKSVTLTPTGNNTATQTLPAGYYSSVNITANGSTAYSAGVNSGAQTVQINNLIASCYFEKEGDTVKNGSTSCQYTFDVTKFSVLQVGQITESHSNNTTPSATYSLDNGDKESLPGASTVNLSGVSSLTITLSPGGAGNRGGDIRGTITVSYIKLIV